MSGSTNISACRVFALLFLCLATRSAWGAEASQGLDPTDRDESTPACVDFYQHANGGWLARNPVPAGEGRWSNYDVVRTRTREDLAEILEGQESSSVPTTKELEILRAFFGSCMDESAREEAGLDAVSGYLSEIAAIESRAGLAEVMGRLHRIGVRVPFRLEAEPAPSDASRRIAEFDQSGMGLRDPAVYGSEEAADREKIGAYQEFAERLFRLSGETADQASRKAALVLDFERRLASSAMGLGESRDPTNTTHELTWPEVRSLLSGLDMDRYLDALRIAEPSEANVRQPTYLQQLAKMVREDSLESWKAYLSFYLLYNASPHLTESFRVAEFEFLARRSGAVEMPTLREQCSSATSGLLGEVLGWEYSRRVVPLDVRPLVRDLASNLKAAIGERIEAGGWMDEPTKREALRKLDQMKMSLLGPEQAPDVNGLGMGVSYLRNVIAAATWGLSSDLGRIGQFVDTDAWPIPSYSTVAGYLPNQNRIVFPAAKFQRPFFDPAADPPLIYGGLGVTIAHEMIHGFDDEGRQYDAKGNVRDWWTPGVDRAFEELASPLAAQFGSYEVLPGAVIDGERTLGENLADLGGLRAAHRALELALAGETPPAENGLTAEQRFFHAWARAMRANYREEYLRDLVSTDVHSPTPWRINGSVSNLGEFHRAFGCGPGDPMFMPPARRTDLW